MLDIIIMVVSSVRRSRKAKAKGYTGWHWGLASVLAFITGEVVMVAILSRFAYGGKGFTLEAMLRDPGRFIGPQLLALMGGIGGALFVKWRLDQMPDRNEHDRQDWLDRLGNQDRND